MSPTRAPRPPAIELPAARVHAWRVERQLLGRSRAGAPEDVARRLIGVQAQVTSSAALSIALRSEPRRGASPPVEATRRALVDRSVVRAWAMRGTLHLFAADDLPIVVAALGGKDNWRRPAWLRWFGVTEAEMERLVHGIGEVLDDGRPRTRAELGDDLGARFGPRVAKLVLGSWGSALKIAGDYGYVCQSSGDTDGAVRFVRPSRWIAGWHEADHDASLREILFRYVATYGPASLREIMRWWGVAILKDVKPAIQSLGDRLTEVEVGGDRGWVVTEDLEGIKAAKPTRGKIHLLGGFDPFVVGAGLREQLIPTAHLKRVSRTAGWISPVVLLDGVAAGVWDSERTPNGLSIMVEPFEPFDRAGKAAVERAAAVVARAQGVTATVGYGRVFDNAPGTARTLRIERGDA